MASIALKAMRVEVSVPAPIEDVSGLPGRNVCDQQPSRSERSSTSIDGSGVRDVSGRPDQGRDQGRPEGVDPFARLNEEHQGTPGGALTFWATVYTDALACLPALCVPTGNRGSRAAGVRRRYRLTPAHDEYPPRLARRSTSCGPTPRALIASAPHVSHTHGTSETPTQLGHRSAARKWVSRRHGDRRSQWAELPCGRALRT